MTPSEGIRPLGWIPVVAARLAFSWMYMLFAVLAVSFVGLFLMAFGAGTDPKLAILALLAILVSFLGPLLSQRLPSDRVARGALALVGLMILAGGTSLGPLHVMPLVWSVAIALTLSAICWWLDYRYIGTLPEWLDEKNSSLYRNDTGPDDCDHSAFP